MASVDLFGENKRSVASWRGAGGGLPHRPPVDECIYHYVHAGCSRQLSKMRDLSYVKAPRRAPTRLQFIYFWYRIGRAGYKEL